jgi:hypothetical protein
MIEAYTNPEEAGNKIITATAVQYQENFGGWLLLFYP